MSSGPATGPAPEGLWDKANRLADQLHRASLVLRSIDLLFQYRLDSVGTGMSSEDAEMVWELVNVTGAMLEGAYNAASEVEFVLSGALPRPGEGGAGPGGAAPPCAGGR